MSTLALSPQHLRDLNHQLRTPLACILGFSTVLERQVTAAQRQFTQHIERSVRELLTVIEALLQQLTVVQGEQKCEY